MSARMSKFTCFSICHWEGWPIRMESTGYMIYILEKILIIATVQGISPHPWVKLGGVDLFNYVLNSCGNVTNNQKLVDTVEDAL